MWIDIQIFVISLMLTGLLYGMIDGIPFADNNRLSRALAIIFYPFVISAASGELIMDWWTGSEEATHEENDRSEEVDVT